jgi:hypothetical protein
MNQEPMSNIKKQIDESAVTDRIVFNLGLDWNNLPMSTTYVSLNRDVLIGKLRQCAAELREACGKQDLHTALTTASAMITDF